MSFVTILRENRWQSTPGSIVRCTQEGKERHERERERKEDIKYRTYEKEKSKWYRMFGGDSPKYFNPNDFLFRRGCS